MLQGLTDIHCHLLPGVDDGPDEMEEAVRMLRKEYEDGVRQLIVTPHYREGMFETGMEKIVYAYLALRKEALKIDSCLRVYLGCEFHTNADMTEELEQRLRPTLAGSRYVLTEFSSSHNYERIRNQVYDLRQKGFLPVLAHIERYPCMTHDIDQVYDIKACGAYIQINAGSLLGENGRRTKHFCGQCMKQDLIDFVATDAHGIRQRKPNLLACRKYTEKKMGSDYAEKIFNINPEYILQNKVL
ncbi:MAG TPA: hypothetical protein IAB63_08580 [Candidatus Onthocola gallistercoris]|uniref:Tyrosine-protein phosphatase n=1 Tax=Candidatus Onthocola gallistercoris TaxID=2840876 RepID=A0A9D1HJJ4_9FIRM|nr:hypothetical protein [Candidatus Onthocola gallistercoris]